MKILTTNIAILTGALLLAAGSAFAGPAPAPYTDADYAAVLSRFVDDRGLVDYAGLKAKRAQLDAYAGALERLEPARYEAWSEKDRLAFWINAYNALTLRMIVDHYPIRPAKPVAAYPANSIRQIPGVWDEAPVVVMGRTMTLDHMEHKILRVEFKEPRIHVALVCAALSCPQLRGEPYRAATLDAQLDDQARRFLADLTKFHIDRESNEVWASEIFQWFVDDFLPGATANDERHIAERKSLAAFASKYVGDADRAFLAGTGYTVRYFKYDWTLNEQPK